jgi:hypothetical protein
MMNDNDFDFVFQENRNKFEDGISTRFSPRIAADMNFSGADQFNGSRMQRSLSFGDASVSTADSSFSWISRGTSFFLKESDNQHAAKTRDAAYNSISSRPQSDERNLVKVGAQEAATHIIPEYDVEMQAESLGKRSEYSKTKHLKPSKPQADGKKDYPTYECPRCNTSQREFISISSVGKRFESPSQYIAIYFFIYMLMSLFIFGMEVRASLFVCYV